MRHLNLSAYAFKFDHYEAMLDFLKNDVKDPAIGFELNINEEDDFMDHLSSFSEDFSPYYISMHAPHKKIEAAVENESPEKALFLKKFEQAFAICQAFNAGAMVMHTNELPVSPENKEHLQSLSIQSILDVHRYAQQTTTQLLVENVGLRPNNSILFNEDEFIDLFSRLPESIGCLFDIGHAYINRWDMERVIATLGSRIKAYHLHTNDGEKDLHFPLFTGQGKLSNSEVNALLDHIIQHSPEATWVMEYAPGSYITKELLIEELAQVNACQSK